MTGATCFDARSGQTKLDIARYYEAMAPALIPHLKDRPAALVRVPDGLDGERFFQRYLGKGQIPGARRLDPGLDPGHPPLVTLQTPEALIGAAQMGVVELHTWNALARSRTGCPWAQLRLAAQGDKVVVDAAQAASNWRREIIGDGAFGDEGLRKRQGRRGRRGRF